MGQIKIRRMGYALGAEVTGVDLRNPLDDATIAEIRRAWLEHLIVCFPNQDLNGNQLVAFTRRFGEQLDDNHQVPDYRDPDNPYVLFNTNKPIAGRPWSGYKVGQSWHSDRAHTRRPDIATLLLAKEMPDVGGDTIYTNMYMAYETLSPAMRAILDPLDAVHDAAKIKGFEQRGAEEAAEFRRNNPPVAQPVVKIHPETGRKALYVGDRVRKFVGMTEEESQPLLDFLVRHAVSYEFTYRHHWSVGDLIMWDNRCTMHIALMDYDLQRQPRHMIRCCTLGPESGYWYTGDDTARESTAVPERAQVAVS
jgi:taurine dioxygenase